MFESLLLSKNLFEVILFFSLGYFSRKTKFLPEETSDYLVKFIINIAFPALVIYNIYYLHITKNLLFIIIFGWFVIFFSIFISYFIGKLLKLNKPSLATFIMMSTFGNTSFVGFPYLKAFLGEESLKYGVVFDQLASFLPVSLLSGFILAYGSGKKANIDIKKVITFPPFIALIFGFLVAQFPVPKFILNSLKDIGDTVIPLAIFSVGMNLKLSFALFEKRNVFFILLIKMIFVPLLVLTVLKISGINLSIQLKTFMLEISMPPMVLASILVINEKLNKDMAVSAVGIGIIISFITLPFIYYLMESI